MPRVLHIEDDPANRLLVRKLLTSSGFEVIDAPDGLEGVRLAQELAPDLVLVDLNIPHLDGYEVALRLRAEPALREVPIVAITAEGSRETSLAVGCDGFLQKPIDPRSFASQLRRYLRGQRESQSPVTETQQLRQQSQRMVAHLEEKIRELSQANARLRELDAARAEFYRNISHELATPMTPIVGYVKLLVDEELGPLEPAQQKALRSLDESVRRLRSVLDNLVDVTGLETGRMRFSLGRYDFRAAVVSALDACAVRARAAGIELVRDLPGEPLEAHGDGPRVTRAVGQLLDNALKFTPRDGRVGVLARRLSSGHLEVVVADSGPGLPREAHERIFEPFYQVDGSRTRAHGGVGVGLAIARKIARGLAGDVRVESPCSVRVGGHLLGGAAFSLTVAERVADPARGA